MGILSFLGLLRVIYGKELPDLHKIQNKGLLAVKIAQHYALRIDFLDASVCKALMELYRHTESIGPENVVQLIKSTSLPGLEDNFQEFERTAFASASVGQVHFARLINGDEVVVKIIKKDFKDRFVKDIDRLSRLFKVIIVFYPKLRKVFDPIGVLDHIKEYTLEELDLRNEAHGAELLSSLAIQAASTYEMGRLGFPKIYIELSNSRVLVSSRIKGPTFDELLSLNELKYKDLLDLFRIHGYFLFRQGVYHGDLHPGNVILGENGKIYLIDTGAISRTGMKTRLGLFNFLDALGNYNYEDCVKHLKSMAIRDINDTASNSFREKFLELYKGFAGSKVREVSLTKQMMDTIKLGVHSGLEFEKGMFSIIKSMMYLDGMVLRCNPDAVLIEDMKPVMQDFRRIMKELE